MKLFSYMLQVLIKKLLLKQYSVHLEIRILAIITPSYDKVFHKSPFIFDTFFKDVLMTIIKYIFS